MKVDFDVKGFREMERALAELPRGTSKGVSRRVMKKVLDPVRDMADMLGPFNVAVTSRLSRRQKAMARKTDFTSAVVSMYVGPVEQDGSHAPHAHLIEFGTNLRAHKSGKNVGQVHPDPFMRPAWDANKGAMLDKLGKLMWAEIEKSVARRAAKAARDAAR